MGRSGPSRLGPNSAARGPRYAPSTMGNKGFPFHMPSSIGTTPQSTSTSRISSGKFEVLDELLEDKAAWKTQNDRESSGNLTKSMARLTMSPAPKPNSTIPEWRRGGPRPEKHAPKAAGSKFPASRAPSALPRRPDLVGRTLIPTPSSASCTFTRSRHQPRMADAGFLDYYPFHRHEFAPGTIIRGVIHEQDILNTPPPAAPPTTAISANHVTHGAFGPVYSENRFLIVVNNRPRNHYLAIPVYSHNGTGVAKKPHRDEYVSLADHRYPAHCRQQSARDGVFEGRR